MVDFIEPTVNALLERAEQSLGSLEKKEASLKAKVTSLQTSFRALLSRELTILVL